MLHDTHETPVAPHSRFVSFVLAAFVVVGLCGCGKETPPTAAEPREPQDESLTPTAPARRVSDEPGAMTIAHLRERLGIGDAGQIQKAGGQIISIDLRGTGASDLSPLKGLQLRQLYLEQTPVTDIAPLEGMPLEQLYLSETRVTDLSPLRGMTLSELNLVGMPIKDITPLKDVEIGTLWLAETPVSDLGPLAGKSLVSLDVRATPVSDLSPLAGNRSLRRLHIGETNVTDLTSLAGLNLDRLIFTPSKIEQGLDVIRDMPSLTGLDTQFDGMTRVKSPEEFWNLYEAGDLDDPSTDQKN